MINGAWISTALNFGSWKKIACKMSHRADNLFGKAGVHAGTVPGTSSKSIALHHGCPGPESTRHALRRGILSPLGWAFDEPG
jgi:hypothetical protein